MRTLASMQAHNVTVRRAGAADLPRLALCDFSFEVAAELVEPFEAMQTAPVEPPYRKDYGFDADELADYLDLSDGGLFVALANRAPIAYMAVSQGWNNYAVIEDIAVDAPHRGNGIARLMLDTAAAWARETSLAGLRLETQSVNVAACRVYKRYGFLLGGHDRYLYRGLHPDSREIALFWYLPFQDN